MINTIVYGFLARSLRLLLQAQTRLTLYTCSRNRFKAFHHSSLKAADLVHVAAEELVVTLQALHKAPRRDDAGLLFLRVDLQQCTGLVRRRRGYKLFLHGFESQCALRLACTSASNKASPSQGPLHPASQARGAAQLWQTVPSKARP